MLVLDGYEDENFLDVTSPFMAHSAGAQSQPRRSWLAFFFFATNIGQSGEKKVSRGSGEKGASDARPASWAKGTACAVQIATVPTFLSSRLCPPAVSPPRDTNRQRHLKPHKKASPFFPKTRQNKL